MVDDRPSSFTRYAVRALPGGLVLLRFEGLRHDLPEGYLRRTAHLPAFWVREGVPLEVEVRRYERWAGRLPARPSRFCNPSEPRQGVAQRFAALAGLPHLTERQVAWVRDKTAMKDRFRQLGLRTARYARVRSARDVERFAGRYGWPVVLKPVDSFACVDTHRLTGPGAPAGLDFGARRWMVEEHLGGTEWEVCGLIHAGEVLDAWPSAMPCRPLDIVDGAMNANISVGSGEGPPVDLRALLQRVVTGMGIDHGYAHMEFFVVGGEVYAGEIGVRLAGCEIPANHGHAYGFDVFGATLDVYLGRRPVLDYRERRCAGDLLLPLPRSGTVRRITPREELLRIPGVIDAVLKVGVGEPVAARRASHNASGYVHVAGASIGEVESRMRKVLDVFTIEVAPA
ncbi:ATP-grasp domain-containing protein [Streptomyces hesseae]|uniref:ATP-dependent carboxylate-amine ligase n=1 Tax=Streptomyces hesseae TaxID=3075519 RepID=A0ABU2SF71_9ACTN|nr:ATP-dependent carboxylate-amine ligase [Streptomyces sp. DSM 40473]MDT0447595.1 ATP-dependent carboxylate-amine ligase [Streptomyces sp. DSM 40473]